MTGNPTQDIVNYHLEEFRKKEFPGLTTGDAFTQYCARLVLKDYNIAQSDYGSGVVDGKYDGGLDGFFIIINKTLALTKDSRGVGGTKAPVAWQQGLPFDVVIFQSKSGPSWDHTALWKLEETVKQFLDSKESLTTLFKTPLNQSVINQIDTFRRIEKN